MREDTQTHVDDVERQDHLPAQATQIKGNSSKDGLNAGIRDNHTRIEPYTIFTQNERWFIVFMMSFAATFSPLTANVYFPAITTIADAFHVSVQNVNLTVTVYMIFQGITPTFWGTIADHYGRRPSFILCLFILLLTCIALALIPTSAYWSLLLLRCIQAAGSASTVALAFGCVADISDIHERGSFVGITNLGTLLGPCVGPILGGVLTEFLGWSYFLVPVNSIWGMDGIHDIVLPETLRSMVGNGSIPAPRWNRPLIPLIGGKRVLSASTRPPPRPIPNPFAVFKHPDVLLVLAINTDIYAMFYTITTTISPLYSQNYPFLSEADIGLCFLAAGGACAIGSATIGKLLDWQFERVKRRVTSTREKAESLGQCGKDESKKEVKGTDDDFPLEHACLQSLHVWIWVFVVCCVGYGWSIQGRVNLAIPLILQFVLGYSTIGTMTAIQTLLIDLFPSQGSSITAANNLTRCLSAAGVVAFVTVLTDRIGPGWTYTIFGVVAALSWPLLLLELKMGKAWRVKRAKASRM